MDQFDDKEIQIGKQVLHEDDLVINVSYKGEQFALRYPDPGIETAIQTEVARRLGGYPRTSFGPDYLAKLEALVTIDLLYIPEKCPEWFGGGPFTCYDEELITELYRSYVRFRSKFRENVRKNRFKTPGQDKRA